MRAGVGRSVNPDSKEAAAEAARAALAQAGTASCDLVMMFATSKQDPAGLKDGVRSVVGPAPRIVGGNSFGIVTADHLSYDGHEVGVAVLSADRGEDIDLFVEGPLTDNEFNAGLSLGKQIRGKDYRGEPSLFFMYASMKERVPIGWSFNRATPLVEGMADSLGTWPRAAGIGMFGGLEGDPGHQYFGDRLEQASAVGVVLSNGAQLDTVIMHGCKPAGAYHTVTKTDGATVLEIDGQPAIDVVADMLGPETGWRENPMFIIFGVNRGDKFGPFDEEAYQNRQVMALDDERGGLIMFETDLAQGAEIQLMRRSIDYSYMEERVTQLMARVGDRDPFLALYIDCAGRASILAGTEEEDATEIQRLVGSRMPLLGLYSAIEIAHVGGEVRPLDWTGVLCVFSQPPGGASRS